MTDMRATIVAKSDQLNADDLMGGRVLTIKINKVLLTAEAEQPVAIHFEGDNNKPYKACKSMRRVLVNVWGPDANVYVGRSLTLYRDDKVTFGGLAVGGIRISHMSNIDREITMALTASKANKRPFTVRPLTVADTPKLSFTDWLPTYRERLASAASLEDLTARMSSDDTAIAIRNKGSDKQKAAMVEIETAARALVEGKKNDG